MAYLTVAEYVARFGAQETTRLTNTAATLPGSPPTYDSAKVQTAIDDAVEMVEGYIGKVYQVPVQDPPRIVTGWVAAIARETLVVNTGTQNQAIEDAATRARVNLKEVVARTLTLPIAEGDTPPVAVTTGSPAVSGDREPSVFNGCSMAGYMDPFTGGCPPPRWTQ